ncbi:hypothetical protein JCM3765_000179 [Sporobolomyces pararoseus]
MSRSTRLYTLCVLFLLAYHPPSTAAQLEQRRVSINQLERRQGFGDLFGGGGRDSTTTTPSIAASSPTAATAASSQANTAANNSPSVSSTSTQTSTTSSQNGFGLPIFGGGRSSSSATSAEVDPTASAVVSGATSATSAISATSASSESASKETSAASQIIVTITSIITNADGSHSTMVSQSASAVAVKQNDGGSGPSGKTWGIIGGVVGGVAILIGAILILWRCTQRRFDNLDGNMDEIKWPELQQDGLVSAGLSTLNPAATRRTGRAGIEMEKDDGSEWGEDSPRLGSRPDANDSQYFDQVPYAGHGSQRGSYYDDPYLAQGATPYPPPPSIGYRPPSASPYDHYDGTLSNSSFHKSNPYGSNEDVPLVDNRPGVPIVRVSSPVSSHRMS